MASSHEEIEARFRAHLERVRNLIGLYDRLTGGANWRASVAETDLLRAAVVFLYGTSEDLLRGRLALLQPTAAPEALAGNPSPAFPVEKESSPKPKFAFTLPEVAAFRGLSVVEMVRDAVAAWLECTNYNAVKDIAEALERVGLPTGLIGHLGGDLDAMMKRRHLIAHRADASEASGKGCHFARSLRRSTVDSWVSAVEPFGAGASRAAAPLDS